MKNQPTPTPPDLPNGSALENYIKQHHELALFRGKHHIHLGDPRRFFDDCLTILTDALDDPAWVESWPWRDDGRFPVPEQAQMLESAEKDFAKFVTSDPVGLALAARDKELSDLAEANRLKNARRAEIKAAALRATRIAARLEEFAAEVGPELLRFDAGHPDLDAEAVTNALTADLAQNIIFAGHPGAGKSRTMAQIGLRLIRDGFEVEWTSASEFSELVGAIGEATERPSALSRLSELAQTDILLFDDLAASNFTQARTARFFDLIDTRHRHQRPTIFTTNASLSTMRRALATERLVQDRILRRIVGTAKHALAQTVIFKKPK